MGNTCCSPSNARVSVADTDVDQHPREMESAPPITVTSGEKSSIDSGYSTRNDDPRDKLQEYLQILRETQTENLTKLREQLKRKPQLFVLNNLVLSIPFFEDFERYPSILNNSDK